MGRLSSKWVYISCGAGIGEALVGALYHDLLFTIVGGIGAVLNWYLAEKRAAEEKANG
jgi:hypothetical protein